MKRSSYKNVTTFDKDVYDFGCMVEHDIPVLPVTVGYFSDTTIKSITGYVSSVFHEEIKIYPRTVMTGNAMKTLCKARGEEGYLDHSMADMDDIARIPYILANFTGVSCTGDMTVSARTEESKPSKMIDLSRNIGDKVFTVRIAGDADTGRNYVFDACIK